MLLLAEPPDINNKSPINHSMRIIPTFYIVYTSSYNVSVFISVDDSTSSSCCRFTSNNGVVIGPELSFMVPRFDEVFAYTIRVCHFWRLCIILLRIDRCGGQNRVRVVDARRYGEKTGNIKIIHVCGMIFLAHMLVLCP
jgi:hypothetical protein